MASTEEEWKSHTTAEGLTYYYNTRSGETAWERPDGAAPQQSKRYTAA